MFPSFTSLSAAWLFLLLIPLIVFYFLKLKRPRLEIPSLVLWRQVLSDQRVNSPFQKFKRNLLLLLQILLLTLLVLAAMQPFLRSESSQAARLPILIDVSASMAATSSGGNSSHLSEVKKRVRELIDGMSADQEISLIAFSKNARRLTPFTGNQRDLRAAIDSLEIEDLPSDLEEALRMTQALARNDGFEKVLLFSDGNFPAKTNFELPFAVDFQRLESSAANYGITACNARRTPGGAWEVFVQLSGSAHPQAQTGTLTLTQDGHLIARETVALTKGSAPRLAFTIQSERASRLHASLALSGTDSLAADNDAWLDLPAPFPIRIYVPPKLGSYRHALSAIAGISLHPREGEKLPSSFDLVITDQAADLALPARVRCTLGLIPEDLAQVVAVEAKNAAVIDWRRDSPLLQHVALSDVIFMDQPANAAGVDPARYAQLGYDILADGPRGPLILTRRSEEFLHIHLLGHTDRSTLPYRVGFPIFVSNLVQVSLQQAGLVEANAARTGVIPPITVAPEQTYQLEGPRQLRREERSDARGLLTGLPAPHAGEYVLHGSSEPIRLGVSLLSPSETSLAAVDRIEFNDQLSVAAATVAPKSNRSLWWALACAGFLVLLLEWWWFNRHGALAA
ncbi:MAG TPA: BatA and WFA domain-containing protein [Chthoniobacteraceae bacterium]|jgi:hypothetical protein